MVEKKEGRKHALAGKKRKSHSPTMNPQWLEHMRKARKETHLFFPKIVMQWLIHKIMEELFNKNRIISCDYWFWASAIEAIHHAAEAELVDKFEKANMCTIHAKHITVHPVDLQLVHCILEKIPPYMNYIALWVMTHFLYSMLQPDWLIWLWVMLNAWTLKIYINICIH